LLDWEKGRVDILVGLRSLLKTEEIVKEESNENMLKGVAIVRSFIICAECSLARERGSRNFQIG
jgi:hypothetical protein